MAAINLPTSAATAVASGTGILALVDSLNVERGNYRNRFLAVTADTPIVPRARFKPTAPGAQTALVVGLPDAANTSNRDHQVRIQFGWQRGIAPNAGGLTHDSDHAPGNETSGAWVRVAEWLAGPNWGSHALPRIGSEVLVEFLHGDIDQPIIVGQLYNGDAAPPFALTAASNHPGTLSGLHSQSHDGSGTQQWVIDDAPGQLRQRLHTSLADSRMEIGYLIDHSDGHRGGLRGQGFDLATLGWGNLRAGHGMLVSTTARSSATSTQLDVAEAVSQLKAAQDTAQALSEAAGQHNVAPLTANARQTMFTAVLDVEQDGRYTGSVGGQRGFRRHLPARRHSSSLRHFWRRRANAGTRKLWPPSRARHTSHASTRHLRRHPRSPAGGACRVTPGTNPALPAHQPHPARRPHPDFQAAPHPATATREHCRRMRRARTPPARAG